jgi:hypothetical protein
MYFRFSAIHELRRQHAVGNWRGMNHQKSRRTLFSSPVQREPSNYSLPHFWGSGQGCPRLRASNEHILIVRVPRAKRTCQPFLHLRHFSRREACIGLPLRASNEGSPRPRVARARETNQASIPFFCELPFSPPLTLLARRLVWSLLRASNEGLLRPRVPRAKRTRQPPRLTLLVSCDPGVCIIRHRYPYG